MSQDQEFVFALHVTELSEEDGEIVQNALTPACDFCLDSRVQWEYPCEDFVLDDVRVNGISFGSKGGWLACERCADRIEARDFGGLNARSLRSWTLRHGAPSASLIDSLGPIQHGFFDHRGGVRTPYKSAVARARAHHDGKGEQ